MERTVRVGEAEALKSTGLQYLSNVSINCVVIGTW